MATRMSIPGRRRRGLKGVPQRKRRYHTDATLAMSIVLPTHGSAAPLLERTLLALSGQDFPPERFEVVVVADGGDTTGVLADAIAARPRSFACRLAASPRPEGDLPHRNHARNAGCGAARGELIWPLDADFLLLAQALSHVWSVFSDRLESGHVAVLTPCMAGVAMKPEQWLEITAAALAQGDAAALLRCVEDVPRLSRLVSGYHDRYRPGSADSQPISALNEGMPMIPARLLKALGGFDEAFLGWGANKQEFARRLVGLAQSGLIEIRLLNSVLALHQPHRADPDKRSDSRRRRHNAALLARKQREIRLNARWWSVQREKARRTLEAWAKGADAASRQPQPGRGLRIGIISVNDPRKGLYRDTEIQIWALRKANDWLDARNNISVFPVTGADHGLRTQAAAVEGVRGAATLPHMVASGMRFATWLDSIDVLITCETWFDSAVRIARERGKRVIFVPNLEWVAPGQSLEQWVEQVRTSGAEVWAKTNVGYEALRAAGLQPLPVSWTIPDPVIRERAQGEGDLRLLMLAGMGGWRNRRGLDIALEAFALARQQVPAIRLAVHSVKPIQDYPEMEGLGTPALSVTEGLLSREQLRSLMESADIMLYPSRWEGFGLSLLEGLHAGLPVLATDGAPMNELVEHGHNGLLVAAQKTGSVRLAPSFECSARSLAEAIVKLANDTILRRRLSCPEPGELVARQHRFVNEVDARMRNGTARRVVVFSASPVAGRRSEYYWADALKNHGFDVAMLGHDASREQLRAWLEPAVEFVLVGKIPHPLLRQIRALTRAPIVLWHHDLTDYTGMRLRWFRRVAPECDLVAVPESSRRLVANMASRLVTLFPGAKVDGDRGPGRRPLLNREKPHDNELLFLGRLTPERVALLQSCSRVATVRIHGDAVCPHSGLDVGPPIWGRDAICAMQRATYVLSSSVRNDIHYTSNRLFNSAGSGACVVAQRFPGIERLYPATSLALFDKPGDLPRILAGLRRDPARQVSLRLAAEEHTWRHHSWNDRVRVLLEHLAIVTGKSRQVMMQNDAKITLPQYWNDRAKKRGAMAAGFHRWSESTFKDRTERAWRTAMDRVGALGQSRLLRVLDFGCGPGRFTARLAALGHAVTGVDISSEMLALARKACADTDCRFVQIAPGGALPFAAGYFNCLWTYTVLQHVPDSMFALVVSELRRVLHEDGYICLLENTHRHSNRTSASGHVVFRSPQEYVEAFPGIQPIAQFDIEGEPHTLFSGGIALAK